MSTRICIILLLSITGYVQTMENQRTADTGCEAAIDSLKAEPTGKYIERLFSAFPSLAAEAGIGGMHSPNATLAEELGFPADPTNITRLREAMDEFCLNVNKTAQAVARVVDRCSSASEKCPSRALYGLIPFTPDVLWAVAELCTSSKAVDYLKTLGHCNTKIVRQPSFTPSRHAEQELTASKENPKTACFISYGRKYACRYVRLTVPELERSGNNIMETCGQQAHNLALEFRKDALRALRCSEFGDFVRTEGWIRVNYRADGTVH